MKKKYDGFFISLFGTDHHKNELVYEFNLHLKEKNEVSISDSLIGQIKSKYPILMEKSEVEIISVTDAHPSYIVVFFKGSGDCPAGCIFKKWYYYEIICDGTINKIGER